MLGAYYSFRVLFPPKKWPRFIEFLDFNKFNYCKSQKIIFDCKKAAFPPPNSKTLFALSPHGILGIGWMCLVILLTSCVYRNKTTCTHIARAKSLVNIYMYFYLQITCAEVRESCCRWLVADVLAYMPFVAHINGWADIHGCCKENMVDFMSRGTCIQD